MQYPTKKDKRITYLGFAFGLAAMVFGLWWSYQIGYQYYGYGRTVATVRDIQIEELLETDGEGGSYTVYIPMITREYSVDGTTFTGAAFSSTGDYFRNKDEAVAFASRFKVGEKMNVFYDPRNARRSFAVNDLSWQKAAGCIFILIGGFAVLLINHVKIRDTAAAERGPMLAKCMNET